MIIHRVRILESNNCKDMQEQVNNVIKGLVFKEYVVDIKLQTNPEVWYYTMIIIGSHYERVQ